jgi:outer membrane lipoprotein-sorting protein
MKQSKKFLLFLLAGLFIMGSVQAQTAEEVVNKHLDAIGGKDKVKSITSVNIENTMQVMGNDAASSSTVLVGKGFRSESDFNGQKMVQVVTDKGGWAINPMGGGTDPQPMPEDQAKQQRNQLNFSPFVDYAANGSKIELAGKDKVGNNDAYKINLTDKDNVVTTYFIDATTYYIDKMSKKAQMMGQDMELTATYSDFKKTDFGVVVPYTTALDFGGQFQMTSTLKKVEFNKPVDPAIFEMKK